MIPQSDKILIPSYEQIIDMNNHYPELNTFISKKERQYIQICSDIDNSDLSEKEKTIRKNTYYYYLMILKKIIFSKDSKCEVAISSNNYGKILINSLNYEGEFDCNLLQELVVQDNVSVSQFTYDGYLSITITLKGRERVQTS